MAKNHVIEKEQMLEYLKRLMKTIKINSKETCFLYQYIEGSGNELKSKFWSLGSSSRLAFDLYSWIANEERIVDFQFEKKLPGIKGARGVPNMDVYIETEIERVFIENKYLLTSAMRHPVRVRAC